MAPAFAAVLFAVAFYGALFASGAAAQSNCVVSTLHGYDVEVQLTDSLFLHWKTPNSTELHLALETYTSGWAAVGWSPDGNMAGSDAVVGNLEERAADGTEVNGSGLPAAYKLVSTSAGGQERVGEMSSFLGGAKGRAVTGAATILEFTRTEGSGNVPVKLAGPSNIIFAYSGDSSRTFGYHGLTRGSTVLDFSCTVGGAPIEAPGSEPAPIEAPGSEPAPIEAPGSEPAPIEAPGSEPAQIGAPGSEPAPIGAPGSEPASVGAPGSEPAPHPSEHPGASQHPSEYLAARRHRSAQLVVFFVCMGSAVAHFPCKALPSPSPGTPPADQHASCVRHEDWLSAVHHGWCPWQCLLAWLLLFCN
ncbi:hypothetical protein CLOP_g19823 [Closterium sp. NIES-67]|nr:hypothetical protein CLOP_g18757 [Closterium sp. NIES-67]GJP62797.1 hypothetical protein CLOP_g19823 [Closterium sp. NIES-67]